MPYELLYIVSESVEDKKIPQITKQVEEIIKKRQGTLQKVEILGRKKIAYPIKKNEFGTFVLTLFTVPPDKTAKVIRDVKGMEEIIRYILTKKEEEVEKKKAAKKAKKVKKVEKPAKKVKIKPKTKKPSLTKVSEEKSIAKPKEEITEKLESEQDRLKKLDEKLDELLKE